MMWRRELWLAWINMETNTMRTKGASLVSHVCYVRIIFVAHFWAFNISMSLFTRRQILKCFCVLVLKEPLVHFVVCLRTSPLGDLHNRNEREENPMGGGWQYGSGRMVKSVTLQIVHASCRSNMGKNDCLFWIEFYIQNWNTWEISNFMVKSLKT